MFRIKIVKEEEKLLEIDKVVKLIHLCRSDSFIAIFFPTIVAM